MSNCEIVTGKKHFTIGSGKNKEEQISSLLFDNSSTSKVSHFIHIEPCQAFKFSTFNLPDGVYLKFHRVFASGGAMPQGNGCLCDSTEAKAVGAVASEPFKIDCKPVVLDNCNGVLFLTIPGTYMLELSDESVLGQFLAFAEEVDCCCLPSGLIIGNIGSDNQYIGVKRGE